MLTMWTRKNLIRFYLNEENDMSLAFSDDYSIGVEMSQFEYDQKYAAKFNDVKASQTATTGGRKFDGGKPEFGLIPPLALTETARVMTYGAHKYEPDNWIHVPDAKRRYFNAAQRHQWEFREGEELDSESQLHHIAHAICNLMFLYEHVVKYSKE